MTDHRNSSTIHDQLSNNSLNLRVDSLSSSADTINDQGMENRVEAYLTSIMRKIHDIDAIRTRADEIESQITSLRGVRYSADPADPNVNIDGIPDCLIQLEESKRKLYEEVALHFADIDHAWQLCRPQTSENRYALWLHYVQGMHWSKVAYAFHVSNSTLFRIRKTGIEELYVAMPEEARRDDEHKAEL